MKIDIGTAQSGGGKTPISAKFPHCLSCPSGFEQVYRGLAYGYNTYLGWVASDRVSQYVSTRPARVKTGQFDRPSQMLMIGCGGSLGVDKDWLTKNIVANGGHVNWHNGVDGTNYLFCDGHVAYNKKGTLTEADNLWATSWRP